MGASNKGKSPTSIFPILAIIDAKIRKIWPVVFKKKFYEKILLI